MVVLRDFLDLAAGAFDFDLAHQAMRTMPVIGGKRLPAIDGGATQGAVGTLAKYLIAFSPPENILNSPAHTAQMQFVQDVGYNVGAEGFHIRRGVAAY